jgi:hypothetical protein
VFTKRGLDQKVQTIEVVCLFVVSRLNYSQLVVLTLRLFFGPSPSLISSLLLTAAVQLCALGKERRVG